MASPSTDAPSPPPASTSVPNPNDGRNSVSNEGPPTAIRRRRSSPSTRPSDNGSTSPQRRSSTTRRQSREQMTSSRARSPVQDSGPVSPIHRSFAQMSLPAQMSFGLAELLVAAPRTTSPPGSVTTPGSSNGSRGRSPSTGGIREASSGGTRSEKGFFGTTYSPMSLASLAVPTTRPLSPPPTFPTFGSASSSDDDHERTGSRGSTLLTASSSFHSALSRASAASTDSDAADDDGELAELASRPSFGRDSRQGEHRRESETSEDTLAGDYSQHSSSITKAGSSRRTSTSFDKPTTVRKPAAPAMAPALLVTELSTASAPAQIQSIGKGSPDVDQGMRFGNASKRKPSLLQRVIKNLQPSSSSSPTTTPPSPNHLSPVRPSFDSATSPTSPTSMPPPKRSSSFASSFLTSPAKGPQRKYIKVHSKNVASNHQTLGKIFLAQSISTAESRPILTGRQMTDEPLQMPMANGESTSIDLAESHGSRRADSRPPSPASAASPTSPSPLRTSSQVSRPPLANRADAPPSRQSSTGSTGRKQGSSSGKKEPAKGKALWSLEWSYDGRYLATAGQDSIIRLYQVRNADGVAQAMTDGANANSSSFSDSTAVLEEEPCQVWQGHTDGILTLCWSKNGFLASGSMDKTARLWHPTRPTCLTIFQHPDFVTSLAFHPKDDRFFCSGCCDQKVRIWSIIEKKVRCAAELPEMCTAVAFSVDGKTTAAGTFSGRIHFFSDTLKPKTQLKVRSTRGKNTKGKKITHLQFVASSSAAADERLLVTSNDSRVRLYRLKDYSVDLKLKGHQNTSSQIAATFSDDGRWIVCGSEDGSCYLWSTDWPRDGGEGSRSLHFEADASLVACASLAPLSTRLLLAAAGDPIYRVPKRSDLASDGGTSHDQHPHHHHHHGDGSTSDHGGSSSHGHRPPLSRPGSPFNGSAGALSPSVSRRSFGLVSPMSERSLELARSLSHATLGGAELDALLDTPLIAVATMRGTVKIFRGDPGPSLQQQQQQQQHVAGSASPAGSTSLRSPGSRESFSSFVFRRRGSHSSSMASGR